MDKHVREMLFGLCNFFDVISRKSIGVRQLARLQEEIVVILCELEMYFPPAFFDIMVHLLVHIVDDIIDLGPTFLHNMMPFERMNGVIKGFVRNRSRWKHRPGLSHQRVHLFLHELSRHQEPRWSARQQQAPWQARWMGSPRGSARNACRLPWSPRTRWNSRTFHP